MDDDDWYYFGTPLWTGSAHDMRDAENRSRAWQLKSTSKAFCLASESRQQPKPKPAGFWRSKP